MKTLAAGAAFVGLWLVIASHTTGAGATPWRAGDGFAASHIPPESSEALQEELNPVIGQYCVFCHNDELLRVSLTWNSGRRIQHLRSAAVSCAGH